ncbi:hypothetical protein [Bacillus atrophaeus]|uniref:hypothetical protein n=1 Tax=Bacillus atrophaeus TaxID=1452 RepID=UPI00077A0E65|nr:hypothetical protein [Bacillus atrophaeus]KAA6442354.1 hypothetical protein DX926_20745 [Bacillus atrophaeus]KXZ12958.1 hypothetical protein AXI57_17285 [Bacillus atrophaeus]MCY8973612.1 hypothetical protein [Bacillus atrophaeus]MCY9204398.1 hypothetical protein [Bacillus atrophaeus]MEC0885340.1 hypothetical protein [Bacillus atrophaeus]
MSDFQDGSTLVQTITGKWFRFAKERDGAMLIDLPNEVILSIHPSSQMISIYLPDENKIYYYAGDLSFQNENGQTKVHVTSTAIKEIQLHSGGSIENTFQDITSFFFELDLARTELWKKRRNIGQSTSS